MNENFTMAIPSPVRFVLDRLYSAGHTAYCVGGCVRDSLMGKTPSDYDVTTSAKPGEMQAVFSDCRVVETGLKHGTLTVVLDGMNIEITTYRIDGTYGDCRHPETVTFTDRLSDDLCRRDFTVNAMAYSPRDGLVDLYGGQNDIKNKVIRCVGRAEERFNEDGLRILRALRFSAVLGFTPDEECASAAHSLTHLLGKISRERIYAESTKLLGGSSCVPVMLGFADVIAYALGVSGDDVAHAAGCISHDNGKPDEMMRYALILSGYEEKNAKLVFDSLKPSKHDRLSVLTYLKYRDYAVSDEYGARRLISVTDDEFPVKLARFRYLLGVSENAEYESSVALVRNIVGEDKCRSLKGLCVKGDDLLPLGLNGKDTGRVLSTLLDAVMREEIPNERESLLRFAEKMK